jgi:hypothetical protein
MIRHFALSLGALLLAAGCGKTNDPDARNDCEYEKLDLSACDRSGLGALQTQGIWNMDLTFDDGEITSGVIKYVGEPQISGLPISSTRVEQDTFLLTSNVDATTGTGTFQYLFAGCRAVSPTQVEGVFRRCFNGTQDLGGTFRAARVQRRAGEGEGSRVELVSEKALPRATRGPRTVPTPGWRTRSCPHRRRPPTTTRRTGAVERCSLTPSSRAGSVTPAKGCRTSPWSATRTRGC